MPAYLILLFTLLLAAWSLWLAARTASWPGRLLAFSMALFIYLYGGWVFGSIYLRSVFAVAFLLLLLFRRWHKVGPQPLCRAKVTGHLAGFVFFGLLSLLYFTGFPFARQRPSVSLHFPFRHGKYLVFQGGRGLPANAFHVAARGAVYAIDLVKLNRFGNRANAVFSKNLSDYETFGDTVYAPCHGIIQRAEDRNPDNIPPQRIRGPHNLNAVLIENEHCFVFLGHFKQGSVLVQEGATVKAGQPLALAGNSGMSLEPHLHLQAHAKTNADRPWYRQPPLFILFDGKAYLLNEVIDAGP